MALSIYGRLTLRSKATRVLGWKHITRRPYIHGCHEGLFIVRSEAIVLFHTGARPPIGAPAFQVAMIQHPEPPPNESGPGFSYISRSALGLDLYRQRAS